MKHSRYSIKQKLTDVEFGELPNSDTVNLVAEKLGLEFPSHYLSFLLEIGPILNSGSYISAIYGDAPFDECDGSLVYDTGKQRTNYHIENNYVAIDNDSNGAMCMNIRTEEVFCIDPFSCKLNRICIGMDNYITRWIDIQK